MRAQLAAFAALVAASSARGDVPHAREDIVELRHGRLPNRWIALGWTGSDAFALRDTDCGLQDDSGIPRCAVSIAIADTHGTRREPLYGATWGECSGSGACFAVSGSDAQQFMQRERDVTTALGALTPGVAVGREVAGGTLAIVQTASDDKRSAAIVLQRGARSVPLAVIFQTSLDGDLFLRGGRPPSIDHVERSPDGKWLALATTLHTVELDYYEDVRDVSVVPMPAAGSDPGSGSQ